MAFESLTRRATKSEKALCHWMIGLTGKGFQNVLHDDKLQLKKYSESFAENLNRLAAETAKESGELQCRVEFCNGKVEVDPKN